MNMRLNSIKPKQGARQSVDRVGRGIGSGLGKTGGRGHKGQKSRSGGYHKVGFEGGQMPLQRRIPKFGFTSMAQKIRVELRLNELAACQSEVIDFAALQTCGIISKHIRFVKIILSGKIDKAITVRTGDKLKLTAGAKQAIEQAGGKVE